MSIQRLVHKIFIEALFIIAKHCKQPKSPQQVTEKQTVVYSWNRMCLDEREGWSMNPHMDGFQKHPWWRKPLHKRAYVVLLHLFEVLEPAKGTSRDKLKQEMGGGWWGIAWEGAEGSFWGDGNVPYFHVCFTWFSAFVKIQQTVYLRSVYVNYT